MLNTDVDALMIYESINVFSKISDNILNNYICTSCAYFLLQNEIYIDLYINSFNLHNAGILFLYFDLLFDKHG